MADYYNAGDSSEPSDQTESSKDDSEMQETFLAPSSAFGSDCDVGDTYTVKVVAKHEDELELKHVRKKKDDDKNDKDDKPRKKKRDRDHDRARDYIHDDEANASIDAGIATMGMM